LTNITGYTKDVLIVVENEEEHSLHFLVTNRSIIFIHIRLNILAELLVPMVQSCGFIISGVEWLSYIWTVIFIHQALSDLVLYKVDIIT
jgi:hypothetical protein